MFEFDKECEISEADLKTIRDDGLGVQMSVVSARRLFDGMPDEYNNLLNAIDKAQGDVHMGSTNTAFVIVKIVP